VDFRLQRRAKPVAARVGGCGEFHGFQCYYNLLNPSAGQPVPKDFSAQDYGLILDRAAAKGMGAFVSRFGVGRVPNPSARRRRQTLSPGSTIADLEHGKVKLPRGGRYGFNPIGDWLG
jgi:hypothetical protein